MLKRMFLMLGVVAVFVAVVGGFKFSQIRGAMAQGSSYQPPPEAVTTIVAHEEQWDVTLKAIGSVEAVNGVIVSADLPGVVEQIEFESGRPVAKGAVLVRLDARQERAQLAAAEAERSRLEVDLQRAGNMLDDAIVPQSMYDAVAAEYKGAVARVGEMEATIARKTIRAPFSGVLGIRKVNLGQYLAGGDAIVSLQALDPVYVNFDVPQQDIGRVTVGGDVLVGLDAAGVTKHGRIVAFDSVIDEETRNVRVQSVFENDSHELRPGMFVDVQIALGTKTAAIPLPASAISYAPFGDSVFIVEQIPGPDGTSYLGVRQQFVKLGGSRGDQIAIVSGLKPGEEVVSSGVFKLRPGAAVEVNNAVQPSNDPAPDPSNS